MPPKSQFTRDKVVDAALEILKESGPEGITARSVADRLDSSVGPIYTCFENIGDLKDAVFERVFEMQEGYRSRKWTEIPFLNMGVGSVCFARDEPVLFKYFLLEMEASESGHSADDHILSNMKKDPLLHGFDDDQLKDIFEKMAVMTFGMAVLASRGVMKDSSTENIIRLLYQAGGDIIFMTRAREVINDDERDDSEILEIISKYYSMEKEELR